VVAPGRDYHYYRKNDDNIWTHKPGYKPSTNLDSNNNFIFNPRKANRDYGGTLNYKNFCGYLCVPRDERIKRMAFLKRNRLGKSKSKSKRQTQKGGTCRERRKKKTRKSIKRQQKEGSKKKAAKRRTNKKKSY